MAGEDLHVVMLPWLAFGHMLPFLQLSKYLAKTGIRISFISTSRNIDRLPKIPPDLVARINLVKLPLPSVDNLPENAEATIDVPVEKVPYLKKAYDLLQHPFELFLAEESPDWVIHDFAPYWVPETAAKFGVRCAFLSIYPAWILAFGQPPAMMSGEGVWEKRSSFESLMSPPDWIPFPSPLAFRHHEAIAIYSSVYNVNESGVSDVERVACVIKGCQVVAVRSCRGFEGEYLDLLTKLYGKPVIPVGLLPPPPRLGKREIDANSDWFDVFNWLDKREPNSVVYVAFGSESELSKDEVFELAYGLELSNLHFVWALRKPHWAIDDMDILPAGFNDRISDRGVVCMSWTPQSDILAHQAIGGCLIHCGWSSFIECQQFGYPIAVLPLMADQGLNARMLVEKGLVVEVERDEDGSFTRDEIAKSLRLVMVEERGESLRLKARQMKTLIPEWERQEDCICGFAKYLIDHKQNDSISSERVDESQHIQSGPPLGHSN